jgi:hypothetical protein
MGAEVTLLDVSHIEIQAAFWVFLAFTPVVSVFWPWWKSSLGKNIVSMEFVLAMILFPSAFLHLELGMDVMGLGYQWTELAVFALAPLNVIWRFLVVLKMQRDGVRHGHEQEDTP